MPPPPPIAPSRKPTLNAAAAHMVRPGERGGDYRPTPCCSPRTAAASISAPAVTGSGHRICAARCEGWNCRRRGTEYSMEPSGTDLVGSCSACSGRGPAEEGKRVLVVGGSGHLGDLLAVLASTE